MEAIPTPILMDRTYLASLVHELRNPLSKIMFASTLLQKDFTVNDQSTHAEYTALIRSSCTEIIALVDELLKQEKQEFDGLTLDIQTISLSKLLSRNSACYALLVQEKQQVFDLTLPPIDVYAQIDPRLINRLLDNLFRNAIKFTPKKGRISVSLLCEESLVRILVADTGIGIASRHHHQLFDPFTSASKGGTAGEQSYGLGLYTVKRIAEAHRGQISVISQPKRGSVFTVTLPRFQ